MRAYGYIRCSGLAQMDGDGPIRQRQTICEYAEANGIEIVQWFTESHTGTDLEGRPEFQRMRLELVSDGVRTVVVEKLDRVARDVMIQETIIADFQRNGIELKSATRGEEDLCSDEPTRVLIRQILGAFFGYERKMIVAKLADARKRVKAKTGRCEGRKPFGTLPGEAVTLQRIENMYTDGLNLRDIARILNEDGVPTREHKRWHAGTLARMIGVPNRHTQFATNSPQEGAKL